MSDGLFFLSAIIQENNTHALREVSTELFTDDETPVYDFVSNHWRRHRRLPSRELLAEEFQLDVSEATEPVSYYKDLMHDRHLYQTVRPHFNHLREAMASNQMEEVRQCISGLVAASRVANTDYSVRTFSEVAHDVMRIYRQNHMAGAITGIPTGYPYLDGMSMGYQPGDLITLVGRTGMGKTSIMLWSVLTAWLMGYKILVVSMEMSLDALGRRLLGMAARVNPRYIRGAALSSLSMHKIDEFLGQIENDDRLIMMSGNFGNRISDIAESVDEYEPDLVATDGIYLGKPSGKGYFSSDNAKIKAILDEYKELLLDKHLPGIATTQHNRDAGVDGSKGSLVTMYGSDVYAHHSSIVMSIAPGVGARKTTSRRIHIIKGREGEQGWFDMNYLFSPVDFRQTACMSIGAETSAGTTDTPEVTDDQLDWVG